MWYSFDFNVSTNCWQINLFKGAKYILLGCQNIKHTQLLKQN